MTFSQPGVSPEDACTSTPRSFRGIREFRCARACTREHVALRLKAGRPRYLVSALPLPGNRTPAAMLERAALGWLQALHLGRQVLSSREHQNATRAPQKRGLLIRTD